jgi:hypothetical protein
MNVGLRVCSASDSDLNRAAGLAGSRDAVWRVALLVEIFIPSVRVGSSEGFTSSTVRVVMF